MRHFENCPINIDLITNCAIADSPFNLGNGHPTRDQWNWSSSRVIHWQQISHLAYFRHLPSCEGCQYQNNNQLFIKKPKNLCGQNIKTFRSRMNTTQNLAWYLQRKTDLELHFAVSFESKSSEVWDAHYI